MTKLRAILFDLDGTLVQTRESSWLLFERTNMEFKLGIDTRQQYFDLFRENMFDALPRVIGDDGKAKLALDHFLDLLRREYKPLVVPGMIDVVKMLANDFALSIISSNAVTAIGRIIEDAGITNCIAHIFGGDVVPDKRTAIKAVLADPSYATLRTCEPTYQELESVRLQPDEVVLVTDTVGDIRHARECGIRTVAVTWGLHTRSELEAAGPSAIVNWPMEIVAYARAPSIPRRTILADVLEGEEPETKTKNTHA